MKKITFTPSSSEPERIEAVIKAAGLIIHSREPLKTFPGSIHWQLNQPGEKGTLELTLLPDEQRLWFSIHRNRAASWLNEAIAKIRKKLASKDS